MNELTRNIAAYHMYDMDHNKMSFIHVLAKYPGGIVTVVLLLSVTCLVVLIVSDDGPNFSDPKAGFKPSGTVISRRHQSLENLMDKTSHRQSLPIVTYTAEDNHSNGKSASRESSQSGQNTSVYGNYTYQDEDYIEEWNTTVQNPKFFCENPSANHARVVFGHVDGGNLLSAENIRAMCEVERMFIRENEEFRNVCLRTDLNGQGPCCPSWSIGNYMAALVNKSRCEDVTDTDIHDVVSLLTYCSGFYRNFSLEATCWDRSNDTGTFCKVPGVCQRENAVYHILHYITDMNLMKIANGKSGTLPFLKYAITFLPVAAGSATETLFKKIDGATLIKGKVKVVAINFGIKFTLFDDYLKMDAVWIATSATVIFLLMWLYTTSLFITAMTIVAVTFSLLIAYFAYTILFGINFFPFMNLLAVVIAVGVGADDVFVYCKIWQLTKSEKNGASLENITSSAFKHSLVSMCVTSFTTAAAFYANYISDITAICCFAVYAGTTIVANFIMMVTWIPATVILLEKWCSCVVYNSEVDTQERNINYYLCSVPNSIYRQISDLARVFFEKILPYIVIKLRYLWLVLFCSLGICGFIVIFYHPKLRLPSKSEFQVFANTHPFEVYDAKIRNYFWFEKAAGTNIPMLPLTIVWGVKPVGNSNKLDPKGSNDLVLDERFDVTSADAQVWLLRLCQRLRTTEFYDVQPGFASLTNCFIENFKRFWMERPCSDINGKSLEPCCEKSKFPYRKDIFLQCLRQFMSEVDRLGYGNIFAGPRYSKGHDDVVALIVDFSSNVPFSYSYEEMNYFYTVMNEWTMTEMATAPPELQNGWFISHLSFYDLQNSLLCGTPVAIGVSVGFALLFAFLTSLNFLISLYSIVSIVITISITIGALVLLGWELDILESTTISIAVGMSIDFTLHYGVMYHLSPDLEREMRVVCAIEKMGSPIAMAALTTFLAGLLMMPSTILAYQRIGTFIMLVMASSWMCSTFFFLSLLHCLGPKGDFGQLPWPSSRCCRHFKNKQSEKGKNIREQAIYHSGTKNPSGGETYELVPLTENKSPVNQRTCIFFDKSSSKEQLSCDLQRNPSNTSLGSQKNSPSFSAPSVHSEKLDDLSQVDLCDEYYNISLPQVDSETEDT